MNRFSDTKIEARCPECERTIHVRLRDIENKRVVTCPSGHRVQLEEKGHGIRDTDRAMQDLERTFKKLGGTFKFKL